MLRGFLTRVHLSIGELLGLTHYRNCWDCKHAIDSFDSPCVCSCGRWEEEDGVVIAITDPCEAVWCQDFDGREGCIGLEQDGDEA